MKTSFVLYTSWESSFAQLTPHQQGLLIMSVFRYVRLGTPCDSGDKMVDFAFSFLQNALDENEKKYQATIEQRSIAGKKGGRPKKKPTYGAHGWVALSQEEYDDLSNSLGEEELNRCIAYLDERAQATTNRNGWADWSLMIKKASQGKWGCSTNSATPSAPPDILPDLERQALEDLQREYASSLNEP